MELTLLDGLFCRIASEKDVQWSDTGVDSAINFYRKFGI